jgi:hypothetical protein
VVTKEVAPDSSPVAETLDPSNTVALNVMTERAGQQYAWSTAVAAQPGDRLVWTVHYHNVSHRLLHGLTVTVGQLPPGLGLVAGAVKLIDPNNLDGVPLKDVAVVNGQQVGDLAPNGGGYIYFKTDVSANGWPCGRPALLVAAAGVADGVREFVAPPAVVTVSPPC